MEKAVLTVFGRHESEKIIEKSSDGPLLFLDYYGIIWLFSTRERPAAKARNENRKTRRTEMSEKTNYGAAEISEDLNNLGEEIATDTERTLDETHPRNFDFDEWAKMREAIKAMRARLDEMEEMIDRAEDAANGYDEDADEGEDYESFWA